MPAARLLMRKIRDVLRLKHEQGLSHRAIAQACSIGVGTVTLYLQRTARRGVGWPLPAELDDAALEARLFSRAAPVRNRARPDCAYIHRERKRDGVTLQLLWEEYAQVHPDGYRYTQFCEIYRQWARRLRPSMRQVHRAGEKTFIDFSGKRPTVVDPRTGAVRRVELFVAVLGASSLIYAEATESQQLPDWIGAHIRMVEYFGGTTTLWVPDQLRSAVTRPCRYEPGVNRTYEDLAAHYGAVVIPARPRKPRDKAAVEGSVLVAPAVGPRAPPQPDLLHPRRAQRGDPRPPRRAQRPTDEEARRQPACSPRTARPPRPPTLAGRPLRPGPLEAVPRQPRLPRPGRAPRLQRAVPAPPRAGRGALHHDDRRGFLQGSACDLPPAPLRRAAVHRRRAHAECPPRPRRVDAVAPHPLGR